VIRIRPRLPARLRHPHTTVRWRLTLLYGALFLACGAALLAATYALVSRGPTTIPDPRLIHAGSPSAPFRVGPGNPAITASPAIERVLRSRAGEQLVGEIVRAQRSLDLQNELVFDQAVRTQRTSDLHRLELESAIALAIMAVISGLLGWLVAGRVLRPLRTITATTRRISEASLHQRLALPGPRDELRSLADTIDGLLERLEVSFEAQRRFVANASHELRTPLATARMLLEIAVSDPDATVDTFRQTCTQALQEGEHQEQLIDALLALAQGQRGIDQREPIDLAHLTRAVLQAHQSDSAPRELRFDVSLEPTLISGDRRLVERLVSNLVENAIRYNVAHGEVHVRVGTRAGQAALEVANTGPLVDAEDIDRLLQPFQRLTPDRTSLREGLGLGLSIVAAIAAAHHAVLDVQAREHGGLRIDVRFPSLAYRDGSTETQDIHDPAGPLPSMPDLRSSPTPDYARPSRREAPWTRESA
jgi:signal transduction histidine kinase